MSIKTLSEGLFEDFCAAKQVGCIRIPEGAAKSPDYEVSLGGTLKIVAEVKQLDRNNSDREREANNGSSVGMPVMAPTKRVRGLIEDAYDQIKPYSIDGIACIVVLYNNAGFINKIDDFTVTTAMFGEFGIYYALNDCREARVTGQAFFGRRKLTRNSCRGISAVCVLEKVGKGKLILTAYHNPFAANPVSPVMLTTIANVQYRHGSPHDGTWVSLYPDELDDRTEGRWT